MDLFKTSGKSHCQTMGDAQCPSYVAKNPWIKAAEAVAIRGAPQLPDLNDTVFIGADGIKSHK